ncbi:MFS transporter [Acinetobacter baumannii]|uniref:MFS transporter n=1 Tax=Acinetobacter baumannii TaxID=470 RepID=UPI0024B75E12|nr:MFS transporter [Acinetobacter baumannii]MDI9752677.1 MFS transporter [Acinetobacter baumannii]
MSAPVINNAINANMEPSAITTKRVVLLCFIAMISEGYDIGIMGVIIPTLLQEVSWNVTAVHMGYIGSAAFFGTLIGCYLFSALSDLFGRKKLLIGCLIIFTSSMIVAAMAQDPITFVIARGICGIGVGGIIPIACALTSEYSDEKHKNFYFALMYCGYPAGALLAALVGMFYLGEYGWRPLIAIGALPLLLVPVFIKYLPESISFLLSQNRKPEALQLADKIGIDQNSIENYQISKEEKVNIFSLLKELFSAKHLRATTLFWSSQIATVLGVYGLSTWLPQIMKTNGYGISSSISFLAIFMLSAGLGSVFIGPLTDRLNTRKTIVMFYLIGAVAIFGLSFNYHIALTYVLVALAGMGITGVGMVQVGYITHYYPTKIRASATGWAIGVGRIGAIMGPIIAGYLLANGTSTSANFYLFSAAALIAAISIFFTPKNIGNH